MGIICIIIFVSFMVTLNPISPNWK